MVTLWIWTEANTNIIRVLLFAQNWQCSTSWYPVSIGWLTSQTLCESNCGNICLIKFVQGFLQGLIYNISGNNSFWKLVRNKACLFLDRYRISPFKQTSYTIEWLSLHAILLYELESNLTLLHSVPNWT